jgi:hypothetical protein
VTLERLFRGWVSSGYVGLLAGPAVIGWLGGLVGLTLAFVLPLLFCVLGVVLAKAVAPDGPTPSAAASIPSAMDEGR